MKLQLKSLYARGCGPLRDTFIDFCDAAHTPRPLTVLTGDNGSGKTTVLELLVALCEILHPDYQRQAEILSRTAYAQLNLLVDGQRFSIFSRTEAPVALPDSLPIHLPDDEWLTCPPEHLGIVGSGKKFDKVVGGDLAGQIGAAIRQQETTALDFTFADVRQALAQLDTSAWAPTLLYLPHLRGLAPVKGRQVEQAETRYQWVYRYEVARTFSGSLDNYLVWLDYAQPELFKQVCDFLNRLNFDGKTFSVHRPSLKAVVTTRAGDTHPVELLSSGEQNILIILLELRRRLVPHSLVLIDEIENSLHPAFQHRLAQGLLRLQRQTPFQLVLTTHAAAFAEILGEENVLILRQE